MTTEEKAKAYDEALERAQEYLENSASTGASMYAVNNALKGIFPELTESESEDEKIRKAIMSLVHENSYTYESFAGVKLCDMLSYLENQKEQKQSEMEKKYVRTLQSLISDFLRGKQGIIDREYYQKIWDWLDNRHIEQKAAERIEDSVKFEEGFKTGRETGLRDGQKYVLNNLDSYGLCKPAEWNEEDEERIQSILFSVGYCKEEYPNKKDYSKDINWLKSLRPQPHWKPSEEQMEALWNTLHPDDPYYVDLSSLYDNLKKL